MYKSAKLIDDVAWRTAHEKQSVFPGQYYMAYPPRELEQPGQVAKKCAPFAGGCKQFTVSGATVNDYNSKIIPGIKGWTRNERSASTQLIGGADKSAGRGEGILAYPDVLSGLLTPAQGYRHHCARPLTETTFDTFACIEAPMAVENFVRGGISTRQGLQYISSC